MVAKVLLKDVMRETHAEQPLTTQCYCISRKGHTSLDSFVVDAGVSFGMDFASGESAETDRKFVV